MTTKREKSEEILDVNEAQGLTIDRPVDYEEDEQNFRVRKFGCTETVETWKETTELPKNKAV